MNEHDSEVLSNVIEGGQQDTCSTVVCQKHVLAKIVGDNEANNAMESQCKLTEEKVEVMDLMLNQNERLILYCCCRRFFDIDAWCAVGKNLKHEFASTKIILPVYTATDEPYWLFYFLGKLEVVCKANPGTKLTGYWFDLSDKGTTKYTLLSEKSCILGKNVVKTDHGALYFINDTELLPGVSWDVPPIFHDTILGILNFNALAAK